MSSRKPRGFTLVEVLVVIVIISLLVGLLIPAVLTARESARRTSCINNQHEIATALRQYEMDKDRLPGAVNTVSGRELSWIAVITPYLGLNDLWKSLRAGNNPDTDTSVPGLTYRSDPRLICPSDTEKRSEGRYCALSYAANCGWYDVSAKKAPALLTQPVFIDARTSVTPPVAPVKTDSIADGASNTLMFSENLEATQWFTADAAENATSARNPYVVDVGILWHVQPLSYNAINKRPDPTNTSLAWAFPTTDALAWADFIYARPSSNHPGGVVATYCDGRTEFLDSEIDPLVYQKKMSPKDADAVKNNLFTTP